MGWPTWAFENHDAPRAISRWVRKEHRDAFAKAKMLLLCTLRGSIILYQGEELGLSQVEVPFERLQDPEAIANWPQTLSRDGARTPLPWKSEAANLGFSSNEPWLPLGTSHAALAVDRQEGDRKSALNFTRECLRLRNSHRALRDGSMNIVEASDERLVFDRAKGKQRLRCTFNLSEEALTFRGAGKILLGTGPIDADALGPYAAVIEDIA
jgi:alpha-glucosidase